MVGQGAAAGETAAGKNDPPGGAGGGMLAVGTREMDRMAAFESDRRAGRAGLAADAVRSGADGASEVQGLAPDAAAGMTAG
jgi:hypothetical protein